MLAHPSDKNILDFQVFLLNEITAQSSVDKHGRICESDVPRECVKAMYQENV